MTLKLTHLAQHALEVHYHDVLLFRYVYEPTTDAVESPRPYFHPLNTFAGVTITDFRPADHRWHHGLSLAVANLSGQNFWGGPTFVRDQGYVQLPNNGRQQHREWLALHSDQQKVELVERLDWLTQDQRTWLHEQRSITLDSTGWLNGMWMVNFSTRLTNVSAQTLVFGSPTTEGRENAGYGGLFWRGNPSFLHGSILTSAGKTGEVAMGSTASWLAYYLQGGKTCTLLFCDDPRNPRYPTQWFVRNADYPGASFALMFDQPYHLEPGQQLCLHYRLALVDALWSAQEIEHYLHGISGLAAKNIDM